MPDNPEGGKLDPEVDDRRQYTKNSSALSCKIREKKEVAVAAKSEQFTAGEAEKTSEETEGICQTFYFEIKGSHPSEGDE